MTKTINNTELLDLFSQLSPDDQELIFSKMGTLTPEYKESLRGEILKFNQDLADCTCPYGKVKRENFFMRMQKTLDTI